MISAVEFKRRGDPGFLQPAGEKFGVFSHVHYLRIGGSCFSVAQGKIGVCEADHPSSELLVNGAQKAWEPERSRDGSDALEGCGGSGGVWCSEGAELRRRGGGGLRHAGPETEQARKRISHKHPIRWRLVKLRFCPRDNLVDEGIKRFLCAVAKVGTLGKDARCAPGREVLFPQVNADGYQTDAFRYLNGGVVGHVTQDVDNRSSSYRGHLRVDGKSGDDRFSRHGVGGARGCAISGTGGCGVVGWARVWYGAHTTRPEPSADSRRFRVGKQQLRGQ